jgi:hypothetical protein
MKWLHDAFGLEPENPTDDAPAKPTIIGKLQSLWVGLRNPSGVPGDLGVCDEAFYRVSGDTVIICDPSGEPTGERHRLKPGETARQVAARSKKRDWQDTSLESDFNRVIHYPRAGFSVPC